MTNSKPTLTNFAEVPSPAGKQPVNVRVPLPAITKQVITNLAEIPLYNTPKGLCGVRGFGTSIPCEQDVLILGSDTQFRSWAGDRYNFMWSDKECQADLNDTKMIKPFVLADLRTNLQTHLHPAVGVEFLPHYPSIPKMIYLRGHAAYADGDGSKLDQLVSFLNPETDIDRDLLKALFITPMWGGQGGARPLFLITSDYGRGVGKTTTVDFLSELYGGVTYLPADELDDAGIARSLGSADEISKRLILIDNVKKSVDSAVLEGLITSREIKANKLYSGQLQYPNLKTVLITLNSPQVSTDIASRAVVIKIGQQKAAVVGDFKNVVLNFIEANREGIISDILTELKASPQCKLDPLRQTRWGGWEDAVLAKFNNADEILKIVVSRRGEIDTEADSAQTIVDIIRTELTSRGLDAGTCNVLIQPADLFPCLGEYFGVKLNQKNFYRHLEGFFNSAAFKRFGISKGRIQVQGSSIRGLQYVAVDGLPVMTIEDAVEAISFVGNNLLGFPTSANTNAEVKMYENYPFRISREGFVRPVNFTGQVLMGGIPFLRPEKFKLIYIPNHHISRVVNRCGVRKRSLKDRSRLNA